MVSRPQKHPALAALRLADLSLTRVAKGGSEGSFNINYVSRCLHGYLKPSPRLRRTVAELLAQPESELFLPEDQT
jgi:hypothetical protein